MVQKLRYLGSILTLSLTIWSSGFTTAFAQTNKAGVEIRPAIIEDRVEPGKTFNSTLLVANLSSSTQTFYLIKQDITGVDGQGHPTFDNSNSSPEFQMSSWINLSADQVILQAGQSKQIPFVVNVPQKAGPGGHFAIVFVSLEPQKPNESGSGVGFQVGSIISLQVAGTVHEDAQIREFRSDRSIYSNPEVKLITKVENNGNTLLKPRGPVEITDMFGRKVATLSMNESAAGLFPQSTREYDVTWHGGKLSLGRYQVVMGLAYGTQGSQTITSTTTFWVLPLKIILPFVGLIILLILILYVGIKFYVRRKMKELKSTTEKLRGSSSKNIQAQILMGNNSSSKLIIGTLALLVIIIILLAILFLFFS